MILKDDDEIRRILEQAQHIAVVGHSDKSHRTSYQIAQYLGHAGYTVYPVNPMVESIDGETSYPNLKALPQRPDIVNVFRRSEHLADIVREAVELKPMLIWAQLGVYSDEAAQIAEEAGVALVMDACIKVEHARLL